MERRRFLQTSAAALATVATAGCSGSFTNGSGPDDDGPDDNDTSDTTDDTTDDTTTTESPDHGPHDVGDYVEFGDGSVVVHEMVAQKSLVRATAPDAMGVAGEDEQFLCVRVETESAAPDREAFTAAVGGASLGPSSNYAFNRFEVDGADVRGYSVEEGEGWVVFSLPPDLDVDGGTVSLTLDDETAAWRVPEAAQSLLRSPPPTFTVESFDAPDSATEDAVPFAVQVTNEGSAHATFRGAINASGPGYAPVTTFATGVPAGETKTWSGTFDVFGTAAGDHHFDLQYVGGSMAETVTLNTDGSGDGSDDPTTTVAADE